MRRSIGPFLATMGARGGSALGGMLLSLLVARLAGAEGLGQFAIFTALLGTLSLLALHGTDILMIRGVALAYGRGNPGSALGLLWHGAEPVLIISLAMGAVGSVILASGLLGSPFPGAVFLMPAALVMQATLTLIAGYAKGQSRAWLAPTFEIGGVSLFAAVILFALSQTQPSMDRSGILGAFIAALLISGAIAATMLLRDRRQFPQRIASDEQKSELRSGRLDFTLIAVATFVAQAGSFLLAAPFLSEADLGLLRAAERLVIVVSFSVLVVDPVIAPRVVKLSHAGDLAGLKRTILKTMSLSGGLALPPLAVMIIWPEAALRLMGEDFVSASDYLRVMAAAHFVTAILGPLSMVLNMTWRERMSMWVSILTLALAVSAIPLLSLLYGPAGFVAAYCGIIVARLSLITALVLLTQPKNLRW